MTAIALATPSSARSFFSQGFRFSPDAWIVGRCEDRSTKSIGGQFLFGRGGGRPHTQNNGNS
jgi:hypothetical protein